MGRMSVDVLDLSYLGSSRGYVKVINDKIEE